MKKLFLSFFCVVFVFASSVLYGATITAQNGAIPNNWNLTTTWVGNVVPTSADDVIIPTGVTVIMEAGGKVCNNITIQSGGLLYGNSVVTSPKYLRVYGSTMTVDGTFGGVADAAGISPYVINQTLTITGIGTCNVSRLQPAQSGQTVIIDISMGLNYAGSSGTGSTALYSAAKENYTVTINAGKTVTMADNAYVAVSNSSGDAAGTTNMTINVYGTLTCSGPNSKFNLNTAAGKTASLTIYSGGTVNLYSYFRGNASNLGTVNVNVNSGGTLNGFAGSFFDLGNATLTMNGVVSMPSNTATFGNLILNSASGITLNANATVNSTLTLTSGKITLGVYNLTTSTLGGSSSSSYIVATGGGEFRKTFIADASFTYPVGDASNYSPAILSFTGGTYASAYAGVKLVNSQHPTPLLPPTDYISRYWTVSQSGISSFSCDAKFYYVDADVVGLESNLYTLKYDNPNWVPFGLVNAGTNELSATVTSFSDFWAANIGAGPVELTSFSASVRNSVVQLSWKTATEINSLKFDVQRKAVNSEWMKIGEVSAVGNSNSPKDYSFIDKNVIAGKYQYRIKMIDADGSYEYSNVVEAEISLPREFSLAQNYPNPFNPSTTINYSLPIDSRVTLELYSLVGEKVADLVNEAQLSGFYSYNFNTNNLNLTSGVYLYKLTAVSKTNEIFSQSKKLLLIK